MRLAINKICKQCHQTYTGRNKSFCGVACQLEHQRLNPNQYNPTQFNRPEHTCELCGKVFRDTHCHVKRRSVRGVFCSNECRSEWAKTQSSEQEIVCKTCGKVCSLVPSRVNNENGNYCSNKCKHAGNKRETITTCGECGEDFITVNWKIENGMSKFCSKECYFKNREKVEVVCETCGKNFLKGKERIQRSQHNYCSKKCYGAAVAGKNKSPEMRKKVSLAKFAHYQKLRDNGVSGSIYDMFEWEMARSKTRNKYPFCAVCNSSTNLHIHHIIPYRASKSHDENNLITLCSSCHVKVEMITNKLIIQLKDYNKAGNIVKNKLFQLRSLKLYHTKRMVKNIGDY